MKKDLPVYQLSINEDLEAPQEVTFMALVQFPAIEKNFMAFADHVPFAFVDAERRIITGPAMLADTPIFRRDDRGEYYVMFDRENVMKAAQKFFAKGYANKVNLGHNTDATPGNTFIFESWITDKSRGVLPPKSFENAPDGSWFVSAKVNDDNAWKGVKDGTYKGFSVEGFFGMDFSRVDPPAEDPAERALEEIKKILNS